MAVYALTEVEILAGRARQALWTMTRLIRRISAEPGFRALQVFHSERDAGVIAILSEWTDWEAVTASQLVPHVAVLLDRARDLCERWETRPLDPLFQLHLPRRRAAGGMAQALQVSALHMADAVQKQKEFGLKAMTLPGAIGVLGARSVVDPGYFFCAVEFDSELALSDFAESATRRDWSRLGSATWWRVEPRLETRIPEFVRPGRHTHQQAEVLGSLSIRIESSLDGASVVLRLCGHLDETALERFIQVRDAVVAGGCLDLTLDVSDLSSATPDGLQTLLTTARSVKGAGGQFILADNQGRFNRILRILHLNKVLAPNGEEAPRRKSVNLPLKTRFTS